jgi:hypothetical protein
MKSATNSYTWCEVENLVLVGSGINDFVKL